METLQSPPEQLSERSQQLWKDIVVTKRKNIISPGRVVLLEQALTALDRADEAAEIVRKEGMVTKTTTTGAVHVHPMVKVERENRGLFAKLWRQLRLDFDLQVDGKVVGWGRRTRTGVCRRPHG